MSNYLIRQNLLKQIATNHPAILHDEVMTSGKKRKAFFKNEADLTATNINGLKNVSGTNIIGPCALFKSFSGRIVNKDGDVRVRNINEWWFLDRIRINNSNPSITTTQEDVYDRTEQIVLDVINLLIENYEDEGGCGWFKALDLNSFQWVKQTAGDQFYGWSLVFMDETRRGATTVPWSNPTPSNDQNSPEAEKISFENETMVTVNYTVERRAKYGGVPAIEVWYQVVEDGEEKIVKGNADIQANAMPPNQTQFYIYNGGAASGFIRLGK
jgi:hypothetical protein